MLKRILGHAALVFLGIFLAFTIIEIGYRWLNLGRDNFSEPHPLLGWFHIPGKSGIHARANFKTQVKINSQGLRDNEYSLQKPPGVYRIIVLGDSFMAAMQVPLEESFPKQLEKILNGDARGKKIEVLNFGCEGFGTDQEYLALKHLGLPHKPDLVILAFFPGNDVRDNYFNKNKPHFARDAQGKLVLQPFLYKPTSKIMTLIKKSKALTTLYFRLAESRRANNLMIQLGIATVGPAGVEAKKQEVYSVSYTDDWKKAWDVTLALIQEIKKISEAHGSKFLLVSLTEREQLWGESSRKEFLAKGFDLERPEKILSDFSRQHRLSYVPLLYSFRDYMAQHHLSKKDFHLPGDDHWTPLSHKLAAEVVKQKIEQDGNLAFSKG